MRSSRPLVICLPHAGGGVSAYVGWREGLWPAAETAVPILPGRDSLIGQPAFTDLPRMIRFLCDQMVAQIPESWMLFGHSMGALLAFELARESKRRGIAGLKHVIVSGHAAPDCPRKQRRLHQLSPAEFLSEIRLLAGTPAEFFSSPELCQLLLPSLQADFQLCETYVYAAGPSLDVPITALSGQHDTEVSLAEVMLWSRHTNAQFTHHQLPGGHFFIRDHREAVLKIVRRIALG
jgi:medium-chain acyl-[acyl-carrier-protein] hydrolase